MLAREHVACVLGLASAADGCTTCVYLRRAALWGEGQRLVREVNGCGAQPPRSTRSRRSAVAANRSRSSLAELDPIWSRPDVCSAVSSSSRVVGETSGDANAERDGYTAFTVGSGEVGLTLGSGRVGHLQCGTACRPGSLRRFLAAGHADRLLVDLATSPEPIVRAELSRRAPASCRGQARARARRTAVALPRSCPHRPRLQGDSLACRFATVCRSARSTPRRRTSRS